MTAKNLISMMVLTGGALAGSAFGQDSPAVTVVEARTIDIYGNELPTYQSRAIGIVYDNGFSTAAGASDNGTSIGSNHVLEDFNLTGGPMAALAVKRITGIGFTTQSAAAGCTTPATYQALLEVFDGNAADYTATDMLAPGGVGSVPIFAVRVNLSQTCGVQTLWTINLAPAGVGGAGDTSFVLAGNQGFIRLRIVDTGTQTLRPYASAGTGTQVQSPIFVRGLGANSVGINTPDYGRDINGDGNNQPLPHAGGPSGFQGGTPIITGAGAGAHEHRQTSATIVTGLRMKLDGDLTCTAPTATALGNIANGSTPTGGSLTAGQTQWYSVNIGAVNDASLTFLDIDLEGSALTDMTLGLYNSLGARLNTDADDGSGAMPHLTYGIGRRSPVGDGRDYDGRDGELVAGTYYIGVGGSATTFQSCFSVANTSPDVGSYQLNIRTNASANGSVPPGASVPPTVLQDFGTLISPGAQSPDIAAGPLNVSWYKFTTSQPTSSTVYLDIDTGFSSNAGSDDEVALFDSSGNLVGTDDDDSLGLHAALSYGASGSPRAATGDGLPFDGRDGTLAAGTYYVAVALLNMTPAANRWHARTNTGSNLGITLTVTTNSDGTTPATCGSSDFDGDGDSGTDADIEAFFACLSGNCCATCFPGGSDFDGDGDSGTDCDITNFFRVLSGNPCGPC